MIVGPYWNKNQSHIMGLSDKYKQAKDLFKGTGTGSIDRQVKVKGKMTTIAVRFEDQLREKCPFFFFFLIITRMRREPW